MPIYPAPALLSHEAALARILSITGADPSKADAVSDVLRLRAPELLTLKEASARFALCSRSILIAHDQGRLPAINIGSKTKRRLLFRVSDLMALLKPSFDTRRLPTAESPATLTASSGESR